MDIEKIRQDFPLLDEVIYFDNACMTLKPYSVIQRVSDYYEKFPACGGGRSAYSMATKMGKHIEDGREAVRELLNADDKSQIAFTKNTTEAINIVAQGLGLESGDTVLTTDKEHNSNLVPWILLEKEGIEYRHVGFRDDGTLDLEHLEEQMGPDVELVSMVQTSNLDGTTIQAKEAAKIVHEHDALFMLDAAQSVPHRPVDVKDIDVDFLAFSVHKMLGPTGVGVLYGKQHLLEELEPLIGGGGCVRDTYYHRVRFHDPPTRFEAGLQNYASLVAVEPAVDYLQHLGLQRIHEKERKLNRLVTEELGDMVNIVGPEDPGKRSGIFNFYTDRIGHHELSLLLDEQNILTRSGTECVHSWYHSQGLEGATRASFYLYNTEDEVKRFVDTVKGVLS